MASAVKQGKFWYGVFYDENHKQKWVKGYTDKASTVQMAQEMEAKARAIKIGQVDPIVQQEQQDRNKPAEYHIDKYETHLRSNGCSANHISYTIADIRKAFAFAGVKLAAQFTLDHLNAWVVTLTADSQRTINRRVGSVKAFLKWCHGKGIVSKYLLNAWKKRKVKGTEKRKCRHLTAAEVSKLLKGTTDAERRDVYKFALLTGFRFSEIGSMRPESFNFKEMTITVSANDAKNKAKAQHIPLNPDLLKMLKARCKGKALEDRIFTMPERTAAAKLLRDDCEASGINTARVMFHSLRHTFITRLAESNIHPSILQELARHSTLETTLQYYVHFLQADKVTAIGMLKAG